MIPNCRLLRARSCRNESFRTPMTHEPLQQRRHAGPHESLWEQCDAMCRRLLRAQVTPWELRREPVAGTQPDNGRPQDCEQDLDASVGVECFLDCLRQHGVQALVYERRALLQGAPEQLLHRLKHTVMARSAWEVRERELLRRVSLELATAGVQALFFKGAALAYALYENPVWRSRTDADLLVRECDLAAAQRVLAKQGYGCIPESESIVYYQQDHVLTAPEGGEHRIDLHWRINNSEVLSRLFSHQELYAAALPLVPLGQHAWRVGDVHALLIAGFHRQVHADYTTERYHWLLDVDLLARRLTPVQWQEAATLAASRGMAGCLLNALAAAGDVLATPVPAAVQASLAQAAPGTCDRYFAAGAMRRRVLELQACQGFRERLHYLRRMWFPPAGYLRVRYPDARWRWLPWLHIRRWLAGAIQRLGQGRDPS